MSDLAILDNVNKNIDIIHKKSERIAAAIFLVSNKIDQSEPLRTRIRDLSLDMVSLSISFKDGHQYDSFNKIRLLEKNILELISILNITSISGLISEMNCSILRKEFELFLTHLNGFSDFSELNKKTISEEFFKDEHKDAQPIKDNNLLYNSTHKATTISDFNSGRIKEKVRRKDQRSREILDLVSKKGNLSIKDISILIKGCSEKTVQRELNSLIRDGLVKKTGERRWSRYSLV